MLRYMLDTNILIYTIRNRPGEVRVKFEAHHGTMCISTVTAMELIYGAQKSQAVERNMAAVEGLLARLDILDLDLAAAQHAGEIRAQLARAGTPIGPFDVMIAGHARSRGLVLVSNNTREFERVDGLRLENWVQTS
ncbi:tRNA(fMet)-specific endonuclease VapC (plasmid) [Cereibacter azotoformans]|uniref:type II toxin-antitoxin system tRNA(fMet)-specific endonuclease VapC n=1 Tax=Cereibacter azotoformans TaxID=43057 RepID=UPI001EE9D948|nr:tRNA(fMet)-specific endonuclease VapC [Cereibacter azotoformans]ULB12218.1 tRNA(fMet)-specific endonuclease VapC [Cereibacter azotoformans]